MLKTKHRGFPLNVLLIEDNIGYCYFVEDVLMRKHAGAFQLEKAHDLKTGLDQLVAGGVDVVLLDLGLPDSARFESFERTFKASPDTPVIILTVLDDDEVAMLAMRGGAQDYLMKEKLDGDLLVRSIRYAVERGRIDEQIRGMSGRLLQLQDEERRHVALALHDSTAQTLAALCMSLTMLEKKCHDKTPLQQEKLRGCIALAEKATDEIRTTAYLLHPPLLDELGLANALREFLTGFRDRSGIQVDVSMPEKLKRLPQQLEMALFRITQEAFSNIHRHSGSSSAALELSVSDEEVTLVVRDGGKGFTVTQLPPDEGVSGLGVGIAGMRERCRQLGGVLAIDSNGGGTVVTARLPVRGEATA